ncbi:glycosyltransferase [Terrimonas sp. NA20]|uniref:Glycosyltransferase n=1 Tax=Terrimonas ginsenosidimutans TaxID=2908004 RepID=A0ABS9KNV2_9BACT|nr:glycosyltransferase [Terrimonas ginsenosidimutans]MCG2613981.1 glycosyltransferase [Terrimonas ginsenosidimutans]
MISVIIPCFNYGHLIGQTIESVCNQSFRDLELIIIDDGSTDNTEQVVRPYIQKDSRIQYYKYPNGGLGTSRNRGLSKIKGSFVQFLDADDLLESRKFEEQIRLFSENPETDVVYGSIRYFTTRPYDEADRKFTYWGKNEEWMPKVSGYGKSFLAQVLKGNFSHLSSTLFRRSVVDKVGLFENEISAVADYHFLLKCVIMNAYFQYHDTPHTYSLVRWHPDNMSKDPSYMRKEEVKMRELIMPLLTDAEARENNATAIKGLTLMVDKSWKTVFLSGGPFDFLKKALVFLGLEKLFRRIFYRLRS